MDVGSRDVAVRGAGEDAGAGLDAPGCETHRSGSGRREPVLHEHIDALRRDGFAIVDGFLDPHRAALLRHEAEMLSTSGRMPKHKFQFGRGHFVKPHIFEADLHDESMQRELPEFSEILFDDSLVDRLSALMPELGLMQGRPAKSLKLQYNAGSGGCFPWHYDNAGRPSKRKVTCVVYLNPEWKDGDGGELVLSPFLRPEVVVRPVMGRAALFLSDSVLHRVLPAAKERYCFTIWLDSEVVNPDEDCNLTSRHLSLRGPDSVEQLRKSPVQRAVSRAVYAEEYEESLRQCMDVTDGCREMVEAHRAHVSQQRSHPQLGPFIEALRRLKPQRLGH